MRIRKEGHVVIPVSIVFVGALYYLLYALIPFLMIQALLGLIAIIFLTLIVRFFRDPIRICPQKEGVVYAPADGKVVVIEETEETEYLKERLIQVSIFMSPLNVHVNKSPIAGVIEYFKYHKGKYLVAWHPKSSTDNERTSVCVTHTNGTKIFMRQIAGAVARRIFFYPKEGDAVEAGYTAGFIRFGSRVDVFLPLDAEIKVEIDQKSIGGMTELAVLK